MNKENILWNNDVKDIDEVELFLLNIFPQPKHPTPRHHTGINRNKHTNISEWEDLKHQIG